jgi:hypothetical protein
MASAPAADEPDVGVDPDAALDERDRGAFGLACVAARLARRRERRRLGLDPDDLRLRRRPYAVARSANFANRFMNESLTIPVGPFRCFARWTSARPCWSVSSGL